MKRTIRLRALLILLAVVAIAPGVAVNIYSSMVLQRDELAKARQELDSLVNLASANQEQLVEGVHQLLSAVASGPSVRRNDLRNLCTEYLRNVQEATPAYSDIGILSLNGKIECQSRSGVRQVDVLDEPFFRNAVETHAFSVGRYVANSGGISNTVSFGMPVYDYSGVLTKVAFATLDLTRANSQLQSISLPKNLRLYVTDAGGHVLVAKDHLDRYLVGAQVIDLALRTALVNHSAGRFRTTDSSGEVWLHSITSIGGVSRGALMVTASVRESDVTTQARTHFKIQLGIMTIAALLGLLFAWLFAQRSLAEPMGQMLDRMRRVEHGEDDSSCARSEAAINAELSELDACFTSMLSKLQQNQRQLLRTQEITRVGFYAFDLESGIYTASPIVRNILGLNHDSATITLADYQALIHPADLLKVQRDREFLFSGGEPLRLQYRIIRPDGDIRWLDAFGFIETTSSGKPIVYSGAIQDITERMLLLQAARDNETRFHLLFANSLDGVLQTNSDGAILAVNTAACAIFGMNEVQLQGRALMFASGDSRLAPYIQQLAMTGSARGELTMLRADGSAFETELSSTVDADRAGGAVTSMILRDITDRKKTEKRIHQLAFFDSLTELPNRRLLLDRLGSMLESAQRSAQIAAVLFVDLDHFKNINDAYGHAAGDALLREVASRLLALMRSGDTVARMGGDEFVILVPRLGIDFSTGARLAMEVAEKVRFSLGEPFYVEGEPFWSGASIGVTLLPKLGETTEDLLREADTAMYRAKAAGRNQIAFFEAPMLAKVRERLALEHDLAQAIYTEQIAMYLQPQWNHQGQPTGCELLMRWTHPTRGAIAPVNFIPMAEETGLILRLGDWVIREGCLTVLRLLKAGQTMSVSVNVSPRQFRQIDFVGRVRAILAETGAPPTQLIFEVTEGLLIENLDQTILRMQELVSIGIRFSIDDFGTGYSSLGYLSRLPLYELKIDRSFVLDVIKNVRGAAIVQSILSMANHMGLHVVAEGVETRSQAEFLKCAGCAAMQGFLLARPMPVDDWMQSQSSTFGAIESTI